MQSESHRVVSCCRTVPWRWTSLKSIWNQKRFVDLSWCEWQRKYEYLTFTTIDCWFEAERDFQVQVETGTVPISFPTNSCFKQIKRRRSDSSPKLLTEFDSLPPIQLVSWMVGQEILFSLTPKSPRLPRDRATSCDTTPSFYMQRHSEPLNDHICSNSGKCPPHFLDADEVLILCSFSWIINVSGVIFRSKWPWMQLNSFLSGDVRDVIRMTSSQDWGLQQLMPAMDPPSHSGFLQWWSNTEIRQVFEKNTFPGVK